MSHIKSIIVFAAIYIGVSFTNLCNAQIGHMESETNYWYAFIDGLYVDAAAGLNTVGNSAITNFNMEFGDSLIITLGGMRTWDRYSNYILSSDYFASAGYILKKKKSVSTFSAGLGYGMYKEYSYDFTSNQLFVSNYNRVGLVVQGKFYYCPLKFIGFGVQIFADVNSYQTNGAIMFSIAIGKLNYLY
jgi:hypothetical protein